MDKKEIIERAKIFLTNDTYAFIQNIEGYYFNGFVKEIDSFRLIFNDDKLGKIPIILNEIVILTYSNRVRGDDKNE